MSKFITVEGIEGAGKSTALEHIGKFLKQQGINFVMSREPGGTLIAEKIRNILLDKSNTDLHVDTELLLMFAARAQHIHELILPTLNSGKWLISDRFVDSSFAYQGGGRGIDSSRIRKLSDWTLGELKPDLTLLLDVEPELGLSRVRKRGESDRFEQEKISFFQKVRDSFLKLAQEESERFVIIDSAKTITEIKEQISKALLKIL